MKKLLIILLLFSSCSQRLTPQRTKDINKMKVQHIVFVGISCFLISYNVSKEIIR